MEEQVAEEPKGELVPDPGEGMFKETRRKKVLRIPMSSILAFVYRQNRLPNAVMFPTLSLPDGAEILAVHTDDLARCVDVVVAHPSFPEIPCGMWLDRIPADIIEWRMYALAESTIVSGETAEDKPVIVEGL